jgi:hypothetical protein
MVNSVDISGQFKFERYQAVEKGASLFCVIVMLSDDMFHGLYQEVFSVFGSYFLIYSFILILIWISYYQR